MVFDFQSFYPTVMINDNLCYSTLLGSVNSKIDEYGRVSIGIIYNDIDLQNLCIDDINITLNGSFFLKNSK